jgi:hypothetical protein
MPTTEGWPRRPTTLRTAVVLGSNGHPPRKSPHVGAPVWRRHGCAYALALQGGVVHVLDVAESRRRASDRGAGWVRRSPPAHPATPGVNAPLAELSALVPRVHIHRIRCVTC